MTQNQRLIPLGLFAALALTACAAPQPPAAQSQTAPAADNATAPPPPPAAQSQTAPAADNAAAPPPPPAAPSPQKTAAAPVRKNWQTAAKKTEVQTAKADGKTAKADGKTAKADGKTAKTAFSQTGKASWYGPGFHGRKTANGERFDMNTLTAAHRTLPISSYVRVTNLANGKSVVVRINDRGPYHGNRVMDLSKAAAQELGFIRTGTAQVKIEQITTDAPSRKEQNRRSGIVTDAKAKGQTAI